MAETIKVLHILPGSDPLELHTEDGVKLWTVGADRMEDGGILSALLQMKAPFELVILEAMIGSRALVALRSTSEPYRVLYTDKALLHNESVGAFLRLKAASYVEPEQVADILADVRYRYYRQYKGTKLLPEDMEHLAPHTLMSCIGDQELELSGDFGNWFMPVVGVRRNPLMEKGEVWEFWPEFFLEEGMKIMYRIRLFAADAPDDLLQEWVFQGPQLQQAMYLHNDRGDGNLAITCFLMGAGKARIGAMHLRRSRVGAGYFLPGGQRLCLENREELFYQVIPGQNYGPLLVYFCGYNRMEGFYGYESLVELGCPLLLLSDPRLKGGGFYLGDEAYEPAVLSVIQNTIQWFGLEHDQVIFAGQSMGAYAAIYYAGVLKPGALVLGRPITGIGTAAAITRTIRPGQTRNVQDVLLKIQGAAGADKEAELDQRIWRHLEENDLSGIEVAVCYMEQDDYDPGAYEQLRSHLERAGAWVYGKGLVGRHDDRMSAITYWMNGQLKRLIDEHR